MFSAVMLLSMVIGIFYIPYLTYKIWRHQHRMHFKAEAALLYQDRPELFSTFDCSPEFLDEIKMLKPGKEFEWKNKKFDIIDTLETEGAKQWVCIQDEDEMALERLVAERGHDEKDQTLNHLEHEWLKTFRSIGPAVSRLNFATFADENNHGLYWVNHYSSPILSRLSEPPQSA
jgi:hypothetical protein